MKIQIFTRNFIGKISNFDIKKLSAIGGAEVYLMQLIKAIKNKHPQAEIIVYQMGESQSEVRNELFTLNHIKLNKFEKIFFPIFLSLKFNKFIDEDAIKIFNYPNYAAFLKKQKKSIGIFHGVEWDTKFTQYVYREVKYRYRNFSGIFISSIKYFYFRFIVPFLVKKGTNKIDTVISVDNNIFNYIKKQKYTNKIKVIYNCVDLKLFSNQNSNYEKISKWNIMVPRNLNVARGVFLLPDIVSILLKAIDNFEVNVIGTGPLKKYLEKEIKSRGIEKNLKLLGHISDRNEMANFYQSADLILIPTVFSEGTSLSALEGLASGKPVIMTGIGGLGEIGINGVDKIEIKANADEISKKILELIKNKDLLKKLQLNSRKCVQEKFNYEIWSKQWLEIIDKY